MSIYCKLVEVQLSLDSYNMNKQIFLFYMENMKLTNSILVWLIFGKLIRMILMTVVSIIKSVCLCPPVVARIL